MDRDFLDYQWRCSTWDEAIAQHDEAIAEIGNPGDAIEELPTFTANVNAALASIEKAAN
ncbi:MAG: hypothetical protein V4502_08175 [Pseudomonadota bacterium]